MKNTLKIALTVIGIALIGFGLYSLIVPHSPLGEFNSDMRGSGNTEQSLAMIGFGALCLISGLSYNRKKK